MHDLAKAAEGTEYGLEGVVLGKSLYEGTIELNEAVRMFQLSVRNSDREGGRFV